LLRDAYNAFKRLRRNAVDRQPVQSSNLAAAGYDPESRTLEIEFVDGGVYQYFDVPQSVYEGLMTAPSHGKFFRAHIRDKYRYAKIS
jgi:hypothetical protein